MRTKMNKKPKYMFKTTYKSYYNKYNPSQIFESILFFTFDDKTKKYRAIECLEHVNGQVRHTQSPETIDNTWLAHFFPKKASYRALMQRVKKPTKFQTTEKFYIYEESKVL